VAKYDLSSIKTVIFGAAPPSLEIIASLKKKFPRFRMRNSWGMTEATGGVAVLPREFQDYEHQYSVGKPLPGIMIKIVDPTTGKELGPDQQGEVCIIVASLSSLFPCPRQAVSNVLLRSSSKAPTSPWAISTTKKPREKPTNQMDTCTAATSALSTQRVSTRSMTESKNSSRYRSPQPPKKHI
jgi:hypothetical protein